MCPLSENKDISIRTGLSARGKIDRRSGNGDSYTQGLVCTCGDENVRMRLPQFSGQTIKRTTYSRVKTEVTQTLLLEGINKMRKLHKVNSSPS